MKYISICSGIEAASVAWHGLAWTPIAFSEIEAFPCAVLAHHWPDVPNLGDMTKFAEWPEELLAECDILVGGPPCQAFSVAGLRRSLDDARGNITLAYVRLLTHIDEVRKRHGRPPAIAVYENVPGLLSTKDNAFGCLVGALAGCDEAVETESGKWPKAGCVCGETRRVGYRILDAQYFGVAQRRRRVFLVAVPCELVERVGERVCPSEILSLRESLLGNPPTRSQQGQDAARSSASRLGGGVYPTIDAQIDRKWGSNQWVNSGMAVIEQPVHIDRAMFNQGQNAQYDPQVNQDGVASSMAARGPAAVVWSASDQANAERLIESAGRLNCNRGQRGGWIGPVAVPDPAYALSAGNQSKGGVFGNAKDFLPAVMVPSIGFNWQNGGGYGKANDELGITEEGTGPLQRCNTPAVAFKESQSGCRSSDVHATIDANKGSRRQEGVFGAMQVRRLTPTECEYLQGFPAGHTNVIYRKKPSADGPRYRALGNSMAVPCMLWLGYRILKATHGDNECPQP